MKRVIALLLTGILLTGCGSTVEIQSTPDSVSLSSEVTESVKTIIDGSAESIADSVATETESTLETYSTPFVESTGSVAENQEPISAVERIENIGDTKIYVPERDLLADTDDAIEAKVVLNMQCVDTYMRTIFDFDSSTEDFTSTLKGMYLTEEVADSSSVGNIYQELSETNVISEILGIEIPLVVIFNHDDFYSYSMEGFLTVQLQSDKIEANTYKIWFRAVTRDYLDGAVLAETTISDIYSTNATMTYLDGYSVDVEGDIVAQFDFVDLDGYLYGYDHGLGEKSESIGEEQVS